MTPSRHAATNLLRPEVLPRQAMPYIEVILVLLLILLNGLLAMSELAIASSRAVKLRAMVERNVNGARRALILASNPGRFLSTVQNRKRIVNELINAESIFTAIGYEATLSPPKRMKIRASIKKSGAPGG